MESRLLASFGFLFLVVLVCDAALPSMVYWNTMLPGVPMPKVVRELLHHDNLQKAKDDAKQSFNNVEKKSDSVPSYNYHSGKQPLYDDVKQSDSVPSYNYHSGNRPLYDDVKQSDSVPSYNYHSGKQPLYDDVKQSDSVPSYNYHSGQKQPFSNVVKQSDSVPSYNYHSGKQPLYDDVKQSDSVPSYNYHSRNQPLYNDVKKSDTFPSYINYHSEKQPLSNIVKKSESFPSYNYHSEKQPDTSEVLESVDGVASKDEVHVHNNLFFLEKDMIPWSKINVDLIRDLTGLSFLPRQKAEAIPFSTDKLTEILEFFSYKPQSTEADILEKTIKSCNQHSSYGEENHCATSLESMVDFIVDKLGRNVKSFSTEIGTAKQQYSSVQKVGGTNSIGCHRLAYPYAVFYCHEMPSTKVYKLQLSPNEDDSAIFAVCHEDTSTWNPEYKAFKILNIKPGGTVCHFLLEGHIVWTSDETSS